MHFGKLPLEKTAEEIAVAGNKRCKSFFRARTKATNRLRVSKSFPISLPTKEDLVETQLHNFSLDSI
jgi:hypothetical protein